MCTSHSLKATIALSGLALFNHSLALRPKQTAMKLSRTIPDDVLVPMTMMLVRYVLSLAGGSGGAWSRAPSCDPAGIR